MVQLVVASIAQLVVTGVAILFVCSVVHFVVAEENEFGRYTNHQEEHCLACEVQNSWWKEKYIPSHVALGPKNLGGDPVAPLRVRNLTGAIASVGYDTIEANTNGCCVEQKPIDKGGTGREFQDAFSLSVNGEQDIAQFGTVGIIAIVGTLSRPSE